MTLVVVSMEEEATFLEPVLASEDDIVVTGPGKVQATLGLVTSLLYLNNKARHHDRVLNLGVALPLLDDLKEITYVVSDVAQVDFGHEVYKAQTGRDVGLDIVLQPSADGLVSLATADYPPDEARKDQLAHAGFVLFDSEAYAYAAVCERLDLDFRSVKAVTGPYGGSVEEWVARSNAAGKMLAAWYEEHYW